MSTAGPASSSAGEGASREGASATARPRVIYIMGSGHSGSTILGVALGNCEGMFFAGELDKWLSRSGTPVLGGIERTRFWAQVREALPEAGELYGAGAHRLLERSSAVLRVGSLPRRRALRARYRRLAGRLFGAIAATAGSEYVIDSSHFPLRASELQHVAEIELYLVLLVRDPEAVVSSIGRLVGRGESARRLASVLKTNADLWLTYTLSLLVFARQDPERRMLVRYEDLVADPEGVLTRILANTGSPAGVPDLEHLQTGIALQANRLIDSETVALKRSQATKGRGGSRLSRILQWPFSRAFERLASDGAAKSR